MSIIRNAAECLRCKDIIESEYTHDFKTCSCGNISVDGGHSYIRRSFRDAHLYRDLTETNEEK